MYAAANQQMRAWRKADGDLTRAGALLYRPREAERAPERAPDAPDGQMDGPPSVFPDPPKGPRVPIDNEFLGRYSRGPAKLYTLPPEVKVLEPRQLGKRQGKSGSAARKSR